MICVLNTVIFHCQIRFCIDFVNITGNHLFIYLWTSVLYCVIINFPSHKVGEWCPSFAATMTAVKQLATRPLRFTGNVHGVSETCHRDALLPLLQETKNWDIYIYMHPIYMCIYNNNIRTQLYIYIYTIYVYTIYTYIYNTHTHIYIYTYTYTYIIYIYTFLIYIYI